MAVGGANLEGVVDAQIITVSEELIGKAVNEFKDQVTTVLEAGHHNIILDCKALKLLDSQGLEALLWLIEEVQTAGGMVKIASLEKIPRKVFEITQFHRIFDIYDDVIAALKSI